MFRLNRTIFLSLITAVIVGCGGGGGGNNTPSNGGNNNGGNSSGTALKKIKVADGYIANADVLVDVNTTNEGFPADSNDYTGKTDSNGDFSLKSSWNVPINTFIYAKGGINVATGEEFNGTLRAVYNGSGEKIMLTPLTTMVAARVENNESIDSAKQKVAQALGIHEDKVDADPAQDKEAMTATQKVVAIAKVLQAHSNNDDVAKVIEKIAKKLDDANLTKAVKESASSDSAADVALKTAKVVEEVAEKLDNNSSDVTVIESAVNSFVTNEVVEAIKQNSDVNETLNKVKNINRDKIDVTKAAACLTFDKIKGSNKDKNHVTSRLLLNNKINCEENNITITWISGDNVNLSSGDVNQTNYTQNLGKLEANVSKNSASLIKPIVFIIPPKGHIPEANDDAATVNEDNNITIDVLANDNDLDGRDELNITKISNPSHGTAVIENNKIKYSPNKDYFGRDSFVYTLTDPLGAEVNATVNVTITPVNDAPIAKDDNVGMISSNASKVIDVLSNDSDIDGDSLSIKSVSSVSSGRVEIVNNKTAIKYTPDPDFNGTISFTYEITDGKATATATVTLEVAKYVAPTTQAISKIEGFDRENGNLDTLLDEVKNTLNSADANDKDAKVALAIVDLIEALNNGIVDLSDNGSGNLLNLIKGDKLDIDIAQLVEDLYNTSKDISLTKIANKLKTIAQRLDDAFSDSNYVFEYKDFKLNAQDAKLYSGLLLLEAAKLEYMSAYNVVKSDYIETKTKDINGTSYEYQVIKVDSVTVLNDIDTLSLRGDAQAKFNISKADLNSALVKLTAVDTNKLTIDQKDKIADIKDKLNAVKTSLNGGANFVLEKDNTKVFINVAALFNESTAPTLSNTLGNDFKYVPEWKRYKFTYNLDASIVNNKPTGIYTVQSSQKTYITEMEFEQNSLPQNNDNVIPTIITKVKENNKTYTGNDILKLLFGKPKVKGSQIVNEYSSASDVNITYTINDSVAGYTGPYNCYATYSEAWYWDENTHQDVRFNNFVNAQIQNNKCVITINNMSVRGQVWYQVIIEDNYGHKVERGRSLYINDNN